MKFTAKNLDDRTGRGGPLPSEEHPAIVLGRNAQEILPPKEGSETFQCFLFCLELARVVNG